MIIRAITISVLYLIANLSVIACTTINGDAGFVDRNYYDAIFFQDFADNFIVSFANIRYV